MDFSELRTRWLPDKKKWQLLEPLVWRAGTAEEVIVPAGFITDIDSVPRVPFVYAKYKGMAVKSAVVHDWLCNASDVGWAEAAHKFLLAMQDEGLPWEIRYPIYLGVRAYGIARRKEGAWSR